MNIKPQIMGVINMTPNSFVENIGKFQTAEPAIEYALTLIAQGADILDIGGEATHPATNVPVTSAQEIARVIPVIEGVRKVSDIPISVDTSDPIVMQAAVQAGATMINDIRALRAPGALEMIAQLQVPVCLMHMAYPFSGDVPAPMMTTDIVQHVQDFLLDRVAACLAVGISRQQIILDPGIGGGAFGKSAEQNLQLIKNTQHFAALGFPVLVGVSFKLFIGQTLGLPVEERSNASLAAALYAAEHGAAILRVHEVLKTKQAIDILEAIMTVPSEEKIGQKT